MTGSENESGVEGILEGVAEGIGMLVGGAASVEEALGNSIDGLKASAGDGDTAAEALENVVGAAAAVVQELGATEHTVGDVISAIRSAPPEAAKIITSVVDVLGKELEHAVSSGVQHITVAGDVTGHVDRLTPREANPNVKTVA